MHIPSGTETARASRRRLAFLLIPVTAFLLGTVAAVTAARTRPEPFRGVYRQEVVPVVAEASGRIVSIVAGHGAEVKPGSPLIVFKDAGVADRVVALTEQCDALRRKLDEATRRAAVEIVLRADQLEKERLETRLRYADLLRERLDVQVRKRALEQATGEPSIADRKAEFIRPASAASQVETRRIELSDVMNHEQVLNTQVTLCEERLAELESLMSGLSDRIERSFGIDRIRNELAAAETELTEAEAAEAAVTIASPAYGCVGIYRRSPGEFAAAGETLVEVFDAEQPYVLLTVPLADVPLLSPGRKVRVEFDGIETRKPLTGGVAEVTSEAERIADAAAAPGAVTAEVRIKPVGRIWPTPLPGSTAFVHLDESPDE